MGTPWVKHQGIGSAGSGILLAVLITLMMIITSGLPALSPANSEKPTVSSGSVSSQFSDLGPEAPYAVHSMVLQTLKEPVDRWQLPGFALGPQVAPPWADKPGAARLASALPSSGIPTIVPDANGSGFTYVSAQWTLQNPSIYPSPRTGAAMAYDNALNEIVLFGGHSATGYLNDTWTYVGGVWTNITSSVSNAPSPRYDAFMTYDGADGYLLLVGGYTATSGSYLVNDSWIFTGTAWIPTTPLPINLYWYESIYGPSLAYDPILREAVFVGVVYNGFNYGTPQVWGYHGGAWSQLPSPDPCAFVDPLAYDSADGYLLSVGGNNSYWTCTLGTSGWTWNYGFSEPKPPYAGWGEMAYDTSAQAAILPTSSVYPAKCPTPTSCSQTWAYNGGNWTNITALSTLEPSGRTAPGIAYDAADGCVVLFGGANSTTILDDTWTLSVVTKHQPTYPITFTESGLTAGTTWSVTLGTATNSSTTSTIGFTEMNGTYAYSVTPVTGYSTSISAGNISVNGSSPSPISLTFYPFPLASVAISPTSASISTGSSQDFSAALTCTGGGCPLGTTYSWALTSSSMGNLNSTVGPDVLLTAGSTTGNLSLFLNATLNGATQESSPATISIWKGSSTPKISSFVANPFRVTVDQPTYFNVTATGGLGALSYVYTGLPAGCVTSNTASLACTPSTTGMFSVRVFTNDTASQSANRNTTLIVTAAITLSSVAVSPIDPSVSTSGTIPFTADPTCSVSPCPSGITYAWTLTSTTLGTLSAVTGVAVTFTGGATAVTGGIFVNATLNGITIEASTVITLLNLGNTISSVAMSPTNPTIASGSTQPFTATPTCIATCPPSSITYAWSLSSTTLGTLDSVTGATVIFTASSTGETGGIFVNATFGAVTVGTSNVITVLGPSNILCSVAMSPTTPSVSAGYTIPFTATPACTAACPSGVTFSWSLSRLLGALNFSYGSQVTYTAGATAGTIGIFVNATLNGITRMTSTVITITAVTLTSVAVSPTMPTVASDGAQVFMATPTCSATCPPSSIAYVWSLSSTVLGTISPLAGAAVTFTAGSTAGTVGIFVNATLDGITHGSSTLITISTNAPLTITSFGASPQLIDVRVNTTLSVLASGGAAPYTYVYTELPGGCYSANRSSLVCAPTNNGFFTIRVWVNDSAGVGRSMNTSLLVEPNPVVTINPVKNFVDVDGTLLISVSVAGGTSPYTVRFSPSGGAASCSNTTLLGGTFWELKCTPTVTGHISVSVNLVDFFGRSSAAMSSSAVIYPKLSLTLTSTSSTLDLGQTVAFVSSATGGIGPYTYSYGGMPPGCVTVNSSTVGCLPTQAGYYNITGEVMDLTNATAESNVSMKVIFDFTVVVPTSPQVGQQFQLVVKPEGGYGTLTYNYSGLPPGCTSEDTSTLSCTPTQPGHYNITISVHDQAGDYASHVVSLTVLPVSEQTTAHSGLTTTQLLVLLVCIVAGIIFILAIATNRGRKVRSSMADDEGSTGFGKTPHMSSYDDYHRRVATPSHPADVADKGEKQGSEDALNDLF